jgi:excisionase family DNA binding protein
MTNSHLYLSTKEYAEKAGISATTVAKWLRSGKLKGHKEGSKWWIAADQLPGAPIGEQRPPVSIDNLPMHTAPGQGETPNTPDSERTFSIEEFSAMSYLTVFGVQQWLKDGRLKGVKAASGNWRVNSSNLQDPNVSRLIRK